MTVSSEPKLYKAERTDVSRNQGPFRTHFNFPGRALPDHEDHGYGPLATVVESFMDPDTHIGMHPHRDEEIISWVPAGVMRHGDGEGNDLVTDADHLMVMNAGTTFRHEEFTRAGDPPLRMLQLFVRPHSLGLEPNIQHEPIDTPVEGEWRHLFGPEGADAPLFVRNEVDLYDLRLDAGSSVDLPSIAGRDTYFYVFDGAVEVAGTRFGTTESGLLVGESDPTLAAGEDATVLAFLIDPDAPVTRRGTIGR
ncbi:pirin family protein [Halorarum halobium]|uniref:pirin family protein n=1 Tax=Halorarum halobium TaxID=3075121 RepID=UPI0028A9F35A|nr:pirin family protein [Halobaculum sp. XH14]